MDLDLVQVAVLYGVLQSEPGSSVILDACLESCYDMWVEAICESNHGSDLAS